VFTTTYDVHIRIGYTVLVCVCGNCLLLCKLMTLYTKLIYELSRLQAACNASPYMCYTSLSICNMVFFFWKQRCYTHLSRWFVVDVNLYMAYKVTFLNEWLPTRITWEWFVVGVHLHMPYKDTLYSKWLSTCSTHVCLVTSVNSNMADAFTFRKECLPTRITREWFVVGVNLHMHH
jgi:hypothetical protein